MEAIEKIYTVATRIKEQFELMPDGFGATPIKLDDFDKINCQDVMIILNRLESNNQLIRFNKRLSNDKEFYVVKAEEFDKKYSLIRAEYQKFIFANTPEQSGEPSLWLSINSNGGLILNNVFKIKKFNHDSINLKVMRYLVENPNKPASREQLINENKLNKKEDKSFFMVIQDLGLSKEVSNIFFYDLSTHTIALRNPVYKSDLDKLGIDSIDLKKFFTSKTNSKN